MADTLTGKCPRCDNAGPHDVLADEPDARLAYRRPVTCAGCALEFVIEVANAPTEEDV